MTATAKHKGHPIAHINNKWVFADDLSDTPLSGGKDRPCFHCGEFVHGGRDPCLEIMPGVIKSCCGHGDRDKAFIWFANGVVIRGFVIDDKE